MTVDYWNYDFKDVIGSLPHDTVDDIYADPSTREGVKQYIYCADGRADMLSNECGARSITWGGSAAGELAGRGDFRHRLGVTRRV